MKLTNDFFRLLPGDRGALNPEVINLAILNAHDRWYAEEKIIAAGMAPSFMIAQHEKWAMTQYFAKKGCSTAEVSAAYNSSFIPRK